jgi:DNA polymerase-3 subunit epsilon
MDFESTGTNPLTDRIVELSMIRVWPDGRRETLTRRVNPGMPIPPETTRVHGITDADIAGAPTFAEIAPEILAFIGDADLAGFNVQRFDLPLLRRELSRIGQTLDLAGRAIVDPQTIYHRRVPRDLAAAYQYYCGKELVDAHHARADIEACVEILDAPATSTPTCLGRHRELFEHFTPRDPAAIDRMGGSSGGEEVVLAFGPDDVRGRTLRMSGAG